MLPYVSKKRFFLENLDTAVAEVNDVDEAVGRDGDAGGAIELSRLCSVRSDLVDENAGICKNLESRFR